MYQGAMVIFPQVGGSQDWLANVRANPSVSVYSGETRWGGRARLVEISDLKDPVLGAFSRKYGEVEIRKRYWGQRRYVQIELLSESEEDYDELVYADLETAFDGVAESYDQHIMGNPMNLWLRNRSVSLMSGLFRPGEVVIEVGCGTGTETLSLAKRGIKVIASDISSRMLKVLQRKASEQGVGDLVVPVHCRPYEVLRSVRDLGYRSVDGAYSTYGAVNTEPRLGAMLGALHGAIKREGLLVLGVWNRFCLYELAGYSLRLRPSMAMARLKNPVPVGKSRFCVTTNAFSVGSLDAIVRRWFRRERVLGVEILLPSSNLVRYLAPDPLLGLVQKMELAIEPKFPWNRLGDHFLGVYRRNG
jgi:SAM-dependent methyltransferase